MEYGDYKWSAWIDYWKELAMYIWFLQRTDICLEFQLDLYLSEVLVIDPNLFIEYLSELEIMDKILQDIRFREQRRLILGDMDDIDKTQLIIVYVKCYCHFYESIFWLNAVLKIVLKTGLRLITERLMEIAEYEKFEDKQILFRVCRWLSKTINTW